MEATFHPGEVALQQAAGATVAARLAEVGPVVIRDHMPQQHRDFFAQLPFMVAGALDGTGQPWATVLAGPPGFARTPDAQSLRIAALPGEGDPLAGRMLPGAPVGLLGIEPHTRRRNRMNGTVKAADAAGFTVHVDQSFGNCPKYIHQREARFAPLAHAPAQPQAMAGLDDAARALIAAADVFFIASAHPRAAEGGSPPHGVDVSHRGGPAGFVLVDGDTLTVPDYVGNFFFNTLGNLQLEPRCGLVFLDLEGGGLLHVAARAQLIRDPARVAQVAGAQRLLQLTVLQVVRRQATLPLRWQG